MFEKFSFSLKQIQKYYQAAVRDFKIAQEAKIPEVTFRFCYDALLKLAITVCAENDLRVKAHKGHHFELIQKLSFYLTDKEIEVLGNEMRSKRNWDLYDGGVLISVKETLGYVEWVGQIFKKAEKYFNRKRPKLM